MAALHDGAVIGHVFHGPGAWKKILIGPAQGFTFRAHTTVITPAAVEGREPAFAIFHEKGNVGQQIKNLEQGIRGQLAEKGLFGSAGIHARKIQVFALAVQDKLALMG